MSEAEEKYPEMLLDLREDLAEILVEAGIARDQAGELAFAAVERWRKRNGGRHLYVCKGQEWEHHQRNHEIYRKFNGQNIDQLSREYGLAEQRIYQILAIVRSELLEKRQIKMFG